MAKDKWIMQFGQRIAATPSRPGVWQKSGTANKRLKTLKTILSAWVKDHEEHLDVLKDRLASLGVCDETAVLAQLGLERGEEALGHGIVPTISFSAHATD